jgi:MFS family permease
MGRTLSVFYGAFNLGVVAGSFLAGVVAGAFGLAAPLFISGGLAFAAAAVYLRFVPTPSRPAASPKLTAEEALVERDIPVRRRGRAGIADLLRTPGFVTVIVTNLAYLWVVAAVLDTLVPLPTRCSPCRQRASASSSRSSWRPSSSSSTPQAYSLTGALLMALSGFAFGFAGVPPAAMLSDIVPEERSGTGVGVFRFCGDLGFTLGPLVAGLTTTAFGFEAAFAVAVVPTIVAMVLALRTEETLRSARASSKTA